MDDGLVPPLIGHLYLFPTKDTLISYPQIEIVGTKHLLFDDSDYCREMDSVLCRLVMKNFQNDDCQSFPSDSPAITNNLSSIESFSNKLIVDFPKEGRVPSSYLLTNKKLMVSFADTVHITYVEDLSYEYRDDLYLGREEMELMRYNAALLAKRLSLMAQHRVEVHLADTSTILGLEAYLTKNMPREIRRRKKAYCNLVLEEQERQLDADFQDAERMASIAMKESEKSRERALFIGLLHEHKEKSE